MIIYSKMLGLITGIVSNGTGITKQFLDQYRTYIDWIGLSLDSGNEITQRMLGRGNGSYAKDIIEKCKLIKKTQIKLKINSVIARWNVDEDFSDVIGTICPNRWKVFQILLIKGQNNQKSQDLKPLSLQEMRGRSV